MYTYVHVYMHVYIYMRNVYNNIGNFLYHNNMAIYKYYKVSFLPFFFCLKTFARAFDATSDPRSRVETSSVYLLSLLLSYPIILPYPIFPLAFTSFSSLCFNPF